MIKKKHSFLLISILLVMWFVTDAVWGGVQMKQPDFKIKVQIKPVVFSEPLPSDYQKVFFNKTDEEIKEITKTAEDENRRSNFLLVSEICRDISKNLSSNSISLVDNGANITVEVSVVKTGIDSLYGPRLIADTVIYKGMSNNGIVFQGEFKQNRKGWFSLISIKTPKQIGAILSKRITKEITEFFKISSKPAAR